MYRFIRHLVRHETWFDYLDSIKRNGDQELTTWSHLLITESSAWRKCIFWKWCELNRDFNAMNAIKFMLIYLPAAMVALYAQIVLVLEVLWELYREWLINSIAIKYS